MKAAAHRVSKENGRKQPANQRLKTERAIPINYMYLRNMSVLGNKGKQVQDGSMLCYFSPYSVHSNSSF